MRRSLIAMPVRENELLHYENFSFDLDFDSSEFVLFKFCASLLTLLVSKKLFWKFMFLYYTGTFGVLNNFENSFI